MSSTSEGLPTCSMPRYTFISARPVHALICEMCNADMLKSVQTARALVRAWASNCVPVNVNGMMSSSPSNAIHRGPRLEWLRTEPGFQRESVQGKAFWRFQATESAVWILSTKISLSIVNTSRRTFILEILETDGLRRKGRCARRWWIKLRHTAYDRCRKQYTFFCEPNLAVVHRIILR